MDRAKVAWWVVSLAFEWESWLVVKMDFVSVVKMVVHKVDTWVC